MRNLRWSVAGVFVCGLPMACADPCLDDGLGQDQPIGCPIAPSPSDTDGTTDSTPLPTTMGTTDTMGTATMSTMSGSQSGTLDGTDTDNDTDTDTDGSTDTESESDTDTDTDTGGPPLWCVDADGDGFGDPDDCVPSDQPIPGSVDNSGDCDDTNDETFPGAAPNDDRDACMQDIDGDNWGDDNPPDGVQPGTDCVDSDHQVFPGAAENEPDLCTADVDNDGWGEINPPAGGEPGTDCLDDNPDVYPGVAFNEIAPDLCTEDEDGDGWGDDTPPPGAEAGTDCDDTDANTFPGAAENEMPNTLCMADDDGDGWGDANPPGGGGGGGGPMSGADCYDGNADLNPDTMPLTTIVPYLGIPTDPRIITTVDTIDASLTPFITLLDPMGGIPDVNLVTATINENGEIFTNDLNTVQLQTIDYASTCMMAQGDLDPVGATYGAPGDIVCGLEFGSDGMLYGIDYDNQLLTFDPATGQITGNTPITLMGLPLDIDSCGMALDCTEGSLLVANGFDRAIYSIDAATGEATLVRDLSVFVPGDWIPVGLEYDPITHNAWLSIGAGLFSVDLDTLDPPTYIADFPEPVSNLQNLPICN